MTAARAASTPGAILLNEELERRLSDQAVSFGDGRAQVVLQQRVRRLCR
jgi:hypothetical protein